MQSTEDSSKPPSYSRPIVLDSKIRAQQEGVPFSAPKGYILIQAMTGELLQSGLLANFRQEYPQGGYVVASAAKEEHIPVGSYVLLEVESHDVATNYFKVFEIILEDEGDFISVICDPEVEPAFVEAVKHYRATKEERKITLRDLSGEGYQFLTSDVVTYQWAEGNSPAFSLLYPKNIYMFRWMNNLYYKVHEKFILAVLEDW